MRKFSRILIAAIFLTGALGFGQDLYQQIGTYLLGGEGEWDYVTYDPTYNRLFIAHGYNVLVVDPEGRKLGQVAANGAHGIALLPGLNLGFLTNGHSGTVTVFDMKTLSPIQFIRVGDNPDAIIWDSYSKHVLVMNNQGKTVSVIDPFSLKVDSTVPLSGKLEYAVATPGKLYVNVQDTNEIAVVDTTTWKLSYRWRFPSCPSPTALAINDAHDTLFTACSNSKILAIDSRFGRVISTLQSGKGTDTLAIDSQSGQIFAANGEGTMTIIQKNGNNYVVAGKVNTLPGARTLAVDPNSHHVFLVTAEVAATGQGRDSIRPGTFKLLVYAPAK
jgi:DNA-binding beta-propeller fold protein YncE